MQSLIEEVFIFLFLISKLVGDRSPKGWSALPGQGRESGDL